MFMFNILWNLSTCLIGLTVYLTPCSRLNQLNLLNSYYSLYGLICQHCYKQFVVYLRAEMNGSLKPIAIKASCKHRVWFLCIDGHATFHVIKPAASKALSEWCMAWLLVISIAV